MEGYKLVRSNSPRKVGANGGYKSRSHKEGVRVREFIVLFDRWLIPIRTPEEEERKEKKKADETEIITSIYSLTYSSNDRPLSISQAVTHVNMGN
jgi:hypothetical protein